MGLYSCAKSNPDLLKGVQDFFHRVANPDGSFRPGIDPNYKGTSDTGLSGMAAPAYATIICHTFGWSMPYPEETIKFLLSCQEPDGAFYPPTGSMDQNSPPLPDCTIHCRVSWPFVSWENSQGTIPCLWSTLFSRMMNSWSFHSIQQVFFRFYSVHWDRKCRTI